MQVYSSQWLNVFSNDGWFFASRKKVPYCQGNYKPDAVAIMAFREVGHGKRNLIVIRQFRKPIQQQVYELPAGLIDAGETAMQAAIREFKEETGLTLSPTLEIPASWPCVGFADECKVLVVGRASGIANPEAGISVEEWAGDMLMTKVKNYRCSCELATLAAQHAVVHMEA